MLQGLEASYLEIYAGTSKIENYFSRKLTIGKELSVIDSIEAEFGLSKICGKLMFLFAIATCVFVTGDEKKTQPTKSRDQQKLIEQMFPRGKKVKLFNGKNLDGWRIIEKFSYDKHGKVEVAKGEIVLGTGNPATGIAYARPFPKINYEVSLEGKRIDGRDFFCGMTFPVGDKDYLTLILGGWGGGTTGLSNLDGFSADENETSNYVEFKQNQWYAIRLKVTKDKIEAWVDKEKIVDAKIKDRKLSIWWEQEPVRPFGIANWNTKSAIRNVKLKRL